MKHKIFGIAKTEVERQLMAAKVEMDPESKFEPLERGKGIEICIEGGAALLSDSQTKEMLRRIYRGR